MTCKLMVRVHPVSATAYAKDQLWYHKLTSSRSCQGAHKYQARPLSALLFPFNSACFPHHIIIRLQPSSPGVQVSSHQQPDTPGSPAVQSAQLHELRA